MKVTTQFEGIDEVLKGFGGLAERGLADAGARASNTLAFGARSEWQKTAQRVFDRPVALTINAAVYRKATRERPFAEVKIRDEASKGTPPVRYLLAEVQGGPRAKTRFERALTAAGVLPQGMFAVPASSVQLDAFGNVPRGVHTRILSALRASPTGDNTRRGPRQRARSQRGRLGYFALPRGEGDLPAGIYERIAVNFSYGATSALRLVFAFVRQPSYRPRYNVYEVAQEYIDRNGRDVLTRELEVEIAAQLARSIEVSA
jgi:hypothetical protein